MQAAVFSFFANHFEADKASFLNFDIDSTRLDVFLMRYTKDSVRFNKLVDIVKFALILFHGQSIVEQSFSINKNLLVENLQDSSLIVQCLVLDYMSANCFEPHTFPINRNLIRSVKSSCQRYGHKLAENHKEIAWKDREEKVKPIVAEVHSLDRERILLETTIEDLREESDRLGYEAEKFSKLESVKLMVTKYIALKQAASDKQA